ncbi:hypothetical protein A9R00_11090 [Oleispira antarctica]|uniref:DUF2971 domain-containing protein n=1 Tax=Oleispira antarctica TaxID=188908 RepID=A0A1Y5HJ64_OLEAN|nr:hypothetical protein A9R00_11090 [Oleispira antarctica]
MNSLYCFLGAEGLIFLKRGYLPFFSPAQLADPWLQPKVKFQQQAKPSVAEDDYRQHLQQQYQQLADNLRAMISFEYFVQQSQSKRKQIEQSLINSNAQVNTQVFQSSSVANWRLLSLYSSWQTAQLWQQFGAAGKGMVVEFDIAKSGFKAESYGKHGQHFTKMKQVEHWQPVNDLYYLFHRPRYADQGLNDDGEWRIVRKLSAADRQIEVQGEHRAMYRLPTPAVKRVILGYACSPEYCQQTSQYLRQDIHYRHIECVQAQLDPQSMRLQQVVL